MSSDSEEDNFCFYGKALTPYDEDAVPKKKPISIEDQIATDTQGRRRFHGAFTGGFSAGFYNTVGSLEGWKPTEFKSSRSEKAQSKQLKPEDFMDDEDIAEHGIAPQTVKATKDYATTRKRKKQVFGEGPIPGEPVLHTLITSGNETIGYLLMKNMELKHKPKEPENVETEGPKVYGCIMPKTYEIRRNVEYESAVPSVYSNYIINPKSNTFGLGHIGLDKTHLNLFKSTQLVVKDKDKKLSISGQAFGVGAFENEDEDIYARDDMSQYDFEMTSEKKTISTGIKRDSILEYFILSKTPLLPIKMFQPPVIPGSFSGKHKVKKSRFEPIPEKHVERRDMNAAIRARYIGEEVNEPQPSTSSTSQIPQSKLPSESEKLTTVKEEERNEDDKNQGYGSNLLLDKFVSSSQKENLHDILEEVKRTESEHGTPEMRDAAKLKMYGPLTRIISDWQPCGLLCKRFNVREPLQDDRIRKNDKKKSHIIFEYQKNNEESLKLEPGLKLTKQEPVPSTSVEEAVNVEIMSVEEPAASITQESIIDEQPSKEESDTVPGEQETKEEKPLPDQTEKINVAKNINLFKAVFLSSSESESEGEDDKVEEENKRDDMMKENVLNELLIPKIKSNKEGILSHIKFNPLFKLTNYKPNEDENKTDNKDTEEKLNVGSTSKEDTQMDVERDPNLYGPVLPTRAPSSTNVSQSISYVTSSNTMDDEWVEKAAVEKKKSHKHKKKHKKEKRKKEHKFEHKSKHKR